MPWQLTLQLPCDVSPCIHSIITWSQGHQRSHEYCRAKTTLLFVWHVLTYTQSPRESIYIYIYIYITLVINYDFAEGGVNFINGLKWTNKKDNVRDLSACWNHQSHKKKTHTIKFVSFKWDLNSTIKSNTFHKLC